jgi:hypothetical protein
MKPAAINESHLDEIEHLLAQSMNGIHLLFDNETIAKILRTPTEEMELFSVKNMSRIQDLFTQLVQRETLDEKQDFLESLEKESFEMLLRTYFHIVDNSLFAGDPTRH